MSIILFHIVVLWHNFKPPFPSWFMTRIFYKRRARFSSPLEPGLFIFITLPHPLISFLASSLLSPPGPIVFEEEEDKTKFGGADQVLNFRIGANKKKQNLFWDKGKKKKKKCVMDGSCLMMGWDEWKLRVAGGVAKIARPKRKLTDHALSKDRSNTWKLGGKDEMRIAAKLTVRIFPHRLYAPNWIFILPLPTGHSLHSVGGMLHSIQFLFFNSDYGGNFLLQPAVLMPMLLGNKILDCDFGGQSSNCAIKVPAYCPGIQQYTLFIQAHISVNCWFNENGRNCAHVSEGTNRRCCQMLILKVIFFSEASKQ